MQPRKINQMEFSKLIDHIQVEADKELSQKETFPENIREQIKQEYDRMIAERKDWLKIHKEEND